MDLCAPSSPVRLILDTTRRCQLSCWYCHSSSGPAYRGPVLDTAMVPQIFEAAERLRVLEITVTGGEPTLWPGLVPLLEQSATLSFPGLALITNAVATPPRVLDALSRAHVSRICVSLDGVAPVHDRNRGTGNAERTLAGIARLRRVHDNITVISVIDATNHDRWPELTRVLSELGVRAHHLAPVCMAGHAMSDYRGLSAEQFAQVRELADRVRAEIPDVAVEFNDLLVREPESRTMPLHQLTERWKGWHHIVRPDGDVRTQIRSWGRSWRAAESVGDLHQAPLADILARPAAPVVPFSRAEEVARKFHLGADAPLIAADRRDVQATDSGESGAVAVSGDEEQIAVPDRLGVSVPDLGGRVRREPRRYRQRGEDGFAFVFDTATGMVSILTSGEFDCVREDLAEVPA